MTQLVGIVVGVSREVITLEFAVARADAVPQIGGPCGYMGGN